MVTCDPNELVAPIHPKAMITVLYEEDWDRWLIGSYEEAIALQRPYPAELMKGARTGVPDAESRVSSKPDSRAVMASAAMNAILEVNRAEDGTATVDAHLVEHALAVVVAMLLGADPTIETADDMRDAAERFATIVAAQLAVFREEHLRTGRRGWDAVAGSVQ